LLAAAVLAGARPARAQADSVVPRWHFKRLTAPVTGGQWGLGLSAGEEYARDIVRPGPSAVSAAVRLTGTYGITTGSTELSLVYEAPMRWRDWRVLGLARSERMQRTPFFGLRNETTQLDSLHEVYGDLYYRYSLLRTGFTGVIERRLAGALWLHVGGQVRHYRASPLKQDPTLFEIATTGPQADTVRRDGLELRAGLVLDSRDDWYATTKGLLLEALAAPGRLHAPPGESGLSYRRYLLGAAEFLRLTSEGRTVLALRQRVSVARDSLPFFLAYEQPTSWMPMDGTVGSHTVRLHGGGTQLSTNHAMATIELRRKLVVPSDNPARLAGLWGQVFVDGAMLWEPGMKASLDRNEWTIGAGLRLQFAQDDIAGIDVGYTDAGFHISVLKNFGF
jgi:outer membrane protein assembly factor BamA